MIVPVIHRIYAQSLRAGGHDAEIAAGCFIRRVPRHLPDHRGDSSDFWKITIEP